MTEHPHHPGTPLAHDCEPAVVCPVRSGDDCSICGEVCAHVLCVERRRLAAALAEYEMALRDQEDVADAPIPTPPPTTLLPAPKAEGRQKSARR